MSSVARAHSRPASILWGLTERELRGILICVCAVFSIVAVVNFATPGTRLLTGQVKGTDFLHFYTIGTAVEHGHPELLYDHVGLWTLQQEVVPGTGDVRYLSVYGPQVAVIFSPLALLPYPVALLLWLFITSLIYGACVYAVWRDCSLLRQRVGLVTLAAAAYYPFWQLIAHGQTTALPLLSLTGLWFTLKHDRPWLCGLAMGTLAVKPQLGLAFACAFLVTGAWKTIAGAVLGILAQVAFVWGTIGIGPLYEYVRLLQHVRSLGSALEPKLGQLHSLRAFWALLLPDSWSLVLYVLTSALVLWYVIRLWRECRPLRVRYIGTCVATVLVAPHLTIYDLTILAPPLLLAADWALMQWEGGDRRAMLPRSILAVYALPMVPFVYLTRIQPSVPALAALLYAIGSGLEPWSGSAPSHARGAPVNANEGSTGRQRPPSARLSVLWPSRRTSSTSGGRRYL